MSNFDVWLRGGPATIGYTGVQGGFMTTMTNDADLMERARAAAVPIEIPAGVTPLELRVVRLRPFVQDPQ